VFLEAKGQVKRRGEADLVGNLSYGLVSVNEQMAGLGEPLLFEILAGRLAHLTTK
jgi:hypothetical protein